MIKLFLNNSKNFRSIDCWLSNIFASRWAQKYVFGKHFLIEKYLTCRN